VLVARVDAASGGKRKITTVVEPGAPHRITGLLIEPLTPPVRPETWEEVDRDLARLAPSAGLLAAEVKGGRVTSVVHGLGAERAGAVGSALKLYVLGALARAVAAGDARWDELLAIRRAWKSIPSGESPDMGTEPEGRRFTLQRYAEQMIAVSDNSATDHLIGRLGRRTAETAFVALRSRSAVRNLSLLTTRELAALKLSAPAGLRDAYERAGPRERRRLLSRVARIPVRTRDLQRWLAPRAIDTIEWFASPGDLGRAMLALHALGV
jgi:beta-lactamase class A